MQARQPIHFTEREYLALLAASERRFEYLNGEIILMAGTSVRHIRICGGLYALLRERLSGGKCEVWQNDMAVRSIAMGGWFFPDISVSCGQPEIEEEQGIARLLNPALIIEVLSPSTQAYDLGEKRIAYQMIPSLNTLIYLAQHTPRVHCITRQGQGWMEIICTDTDALIALPPLEISLTLAALYTDVPLSP